MEDDYDVPGKFKLGHKRRATPDYTNLTPMSCSEAEPELAGRRNAVNSTGFGARSASPHLNFLHRKTVCPDDNTGVEIARVVLF
jgi:hypothetical protein